MKKLYFIQYFGDDLVLENNIKSLGRNYRVFGGWVVESISDAKSISEFITRHYPSKEILVLGLDKSNFWGRHTTELWDMFK